MSDDVQRMLRDAFSKAGLFWVELQNDRKEEGKLIGFEAEAKNPKPCFSRSDWGENGRDSEGSARAPGTFIPCGVANMRGGQNKGKVVHCEPCFSWLPDELRAPEEQREQMSSLFARNLNNPTKGAKVRYFEMLERFYVQARDLQEAWNEAHATLRAEIEAEYNFHLITDLLEDQVWTYKVRRKGEDPDVLTEETDRKLLNFLADDAGIAANDEVARSIACFERSSFATNMSGETARLVEEGFRFVQFDRASA